MQSILSDVNAVEGVTSSFIFGEAGNILAQLVSPGLDQADPSAAVGEVVSRIVAAAKAGSQQKLGDIDLMYDDGRIILKLLGGEGCLCIVCVNQINLSLLNLTANLAVKKLEQMIREMTAAGVDAEQEMVGTVKVSRPSTAKMTRAEMLAATSRQR